MNPPKRAMPAFLQNITNANQNIICTAKGNDVRKASIADLLSERLRIPIFQRRYCWGRDQWDTLLDDALIVADGSKEKHALGRITCVRSNASGDGRLLVIDGQQRNTTCSLLLAAIRDVALSKHPGNDACQNLAGKLNSYLFPGAADFQAWLLQDREIVEGMSLDFAALIPTYCDRASYYSAILPPQSGVSALEAFGEWRRPWEAKCHFVNQLHAFDSDRLVRLAEAVLHKLEWLLFPISIDGDHQDGTEDLQVIFERLAIRDATWCKPTRATEFASMGAADFVRNLLLGSFRQEADAIKMYKQYWLEIEQAAADASIRNRTSNIAEVLEGMMSKFLKEQAEDSQTTTLQQSVVGGQLYPRFRRWFTVALSSDVSSEFGESEAEAMERKTNTILRRLHEFAIGFLARTNFSDEERVLGVSATKTNGKQQTRVASAAKWRCSRCSFPNQAGSNQCTACCLTRS